MGHFWSADRQGQHDCHVLTLRARPEAGTPSPSQHYAGHSVLGTIMEKDDPPVYVFDTHLEAEEAIHALRRADFDVTKLSLIGKGYHSEEHPVGFYTIGDKIRSWGGVGAFWGGIWGLLLAPAVFFLPGLGLVAMAGPVGVALVAALEGAVVLGGISALGAALTQIGVPKDQVIKYETAIKVDKYVLLVHGTAEDEVKARGVLSKPKLWDTACT